MPDIELRFHKDMLVLSSPVDAVLERQGVDLNQDREFINLIEPEAVRDIYRLEDAAGAQILVTNTSSITRARLAHSNVEDRDIEIATAALTILKSLNPQHIFAEIGPCYLPLDISSAASLKQTKAQYEQAVSAFGKSGYDAFFVNGMRNPVDMQCALMGIRTLSETPIVASIEADTYSCEEDILDTLVMMQEYGSHVVGFSSSAPHNVVVELTKKCRKVLDLPLIVQLKVKRIDAKQLESTEENPYFHADTMIEMATHLRGAGAQFLRAEGSATPSYTAALVAASAGFDIVLTD